MSPAPLAPCGPAGGRHGRLLPAAPRGREENGRHGLWAEGAGLPSAGLRGKRGAWRWAQSQRWGASESGLPASKALKHFREHRAFILPSEGGGGGVTPASEVLQPTSFTAASIPCNHQDPTVCDEEENFHKYLLTPTVRESKKKLIAEFGVVCKLCHCCNINREVLFMLGKGNCTKHFRGGCSVFKYN